MIDRAVRTRDAWTESLICSSVGGEKSRDRARKGKGFAILDRLTTLFLRGEMKEGQRAARCQRKYAPRVFQNTLANVPRPIDQEITGNDIRTSLCIRAVRSCAETRLPVSLLSGHLIFLWRGEKYFGQTIPIECLLFPFFLFSSKRKKFLHRQSWKMCKFNFLWTWNISLFLFSFLKIARREHVLCSTKRLKKMDFILFYLQFWFNYNLSSIKSNRVRVGRNKKYDEKKGNIGRSYHPPTVFIDNCDRRAITWTVRSHRGDIDGHFAVTPVGRALPPRCVTVFALIPRFADNYRW